MPNTPLLRDLLVRLAGYLSPGPERPVFGIGTVYPIQRQRNIWKHTMSGKNKPRIPNVNVVVRGHFVWLVDFLCRIRPARHLCSPRAVCARRRHFGASRLYRASRRLAGRRPGPYRDRTTRAR